MISSTNLCVLYHLLEIPEIPDTVGQVPTFVNFRERLKNEGHIDVEMSNNWHELV